jgi:hypothetical protein
LEIKDENSRNKKTLTFCESHHRARKLAKNSKNKRVFEVLWTVDAVEGFLSHTIGYFILRWIK